MARSIVLLNAFLYAFVAAVGGYEVYVLLYLHRLPEHLSAILPYALVMRLLFVVPSLICIFGLVRRARWGRDAAIAWNVSLGLMMGVIPFVVTAIASFWVGGNVMDSLPQGSLRAELLAFACIFLSMAAAMKTRSVCQYFELH